MDTASNTAGDSPPSPPPRRRRRRHRWRRALVQLAACLVLLELGVRLASVLSPHLALLLYAPGRYDDTLASSVPELLDTTIIGHRPRTRAAGFILNSRGFRTPEYELDKPQGTLRVVLLGDSFAYSCSGMPRETFWPPLVERGLADLTDRDVELINLGMPSVGPEFYLRMWELEGSQLEADIVLIAVFVGNDLGSAHKQEDTASWLVQNSFVARLVNNAWVIHTAELEPGLMVEEDSYEVLPEGGYQVADYAQTYATRPRPGMSEARLAKVERDRAWVCDASETERFAKQFLGVSAALSALADSVQAQGALPVFVVIPDRFQVDEDDRRSVSSARPDIDWDRPQRRLAELARSRDVPIIDLLPALLADTSGATLYNRGDTHWSPEGCVLAARTIVEWFQGAEGAAALVTDR